ncbi:hypothetical protein CP533_4643 [Ophiocordyceps camponoti-saundersi (nom. inval.)]|nr:hypothetical protein CP533_4643 [Ophiocordyceps camponoti-saundersi (nom. inval.)]
MASSTVGKRQPETQPPVPVPVPQQQQQQQKKNGVSSDSLYRGLTRIHPLRLAQGFNLYRIVFGIAIYLGLNLIISLVMRKDQRAVSVTDPETGRPVAVAANMDGIPPYQLRPKTLNEGAQYRSIPRRIAPIWPQDSLVDIVVTLSPSFNPKPIAQTPAEYVVLKENGFRMDDRSDVRTIDTKFTVPPAVQNNGTLWGHFYIGLAGSQLDPHEAGFDSDKAYHFVHPLTQYLAKKRVAKTRNLLDTRSDEEPEEPVPAGPVIASHYHANASFAFVPAMGVKDLSQLHPGLGQFVRLETTGARDGSDPLLFVNTFWQLTSHMTVLNETVKELPLHIELKNMAFWQFQILASIEANSKENARQAAFGASLPGGGDGTEIEMVKEIFMDTNPILLAITAVVTVAHLVLETLAFGSDIAHYRKKKDNVGISVRSILANVVMQAIIFLYLLDNSQNTSWMILGTQGVGILIELWKITTVVNVRLRAAAPGSLLPWRLVMEDKHKLTETEAKTKEYDQVAFRYMYAVAVPLLAAYGIYSLVYETHKSWYSFVITTLVGSVYAYGFLMMVPSLYINYRLKSVAHMPGKAMMYKFLNTFIDDLFAFTIKMPVLHRLATFRDDIIFFVYIYQRWAYRTDYTRVNEFGQGGGDGEEKKEEKKEEGEGDDGAKRGREEEEEEEKGRATGRDGGGTATRRR